MAAASRNRVHIVGIGDDGLEGLTQRARELVENAEKLLGTEATLSLIPPTSAERFTIRADLEAAVAVIADASDQRMVLLASGDPLFYGVARFLCDRLGKDRFEVMPHVSSMQMAFARVKESWEDAYLTNLANRPLGEVVEKIRSAQTVGLFTSEEHPPSAVAKALLQRGVDYYSAYVCENLGSPDERVTQGELAEMAEMEFSPLNVMILVRKPDIPDRPAESEGRRLFGNPDDAFLQSRPKQGLLTPAEIRCLALAEMELRRASVVWDIGAGSGSLSVEAASIASEGTVYAIEMDQEDYELIQENAEKLATPNVIPVLGQAPDAWEDLPTPDAIFVGGSGREVNRIVQLAFERLGTGGRLVANVGSIENLAAVRESLETVGQDVQVWMVNVARGTYQLERTRFVALNPSFLLACTKPS